MEKASLNYVLTRMDTLYALWKKDQSYQPNPKDTSSDSKPKSLFPVVFAENPLLTNTRDVASTPKEVAPTSRATQDELPCDSSPEALFPVEQNY
jgi:hypothetical protein